MNFDIVRGTEADSLLEDYGFRAEWFPLCQRCHWATPFQGPDFACTWYRIYRSRFEPVLVLSRSQDGTLNGLLPLAVSSKGGELIVAGGHQAEYQAWICSPNSGDEFACQMVRTLRQEFPGAVLTFRYLPPGTPTSWFASTEAGRSCKLAPHRRPLLRFADGKETMKSLHKKSNKSRLNRLERIGPLEFRRISDPKEFEEHFNDLIQCYDFRQAAVHGVAPFREDELKKPFHLAMMNIPGLLHATVLKVGNQFAAAHLGACGNKEVQLGIITHNPLFARHSPGKFHILFLAQMLIEEGYQQLDLTPGGDAYKDRFANGFDEVHTLTLFLSLGQRMKDTIRAGFAEAIKTSLRTIGVEPQYIKSLGNRLKNVHAAQAPETLVRSARQWLGRRREVRIYSYDATSVPEPGGPRVIRCNAPEDLLRYQPREGRQSRHQFLSTSLQRIENGLRVYTYAENDSLLSYGWLVERQGKLFVSEVGQEFTFPPNSAYLFDFHTFPQARGRELLTQFLRTMLQDAARIPGTARTFISVLADNTPLRNAVEEVGFAHECSLFEEVRLGRARRWSRLPDASETDSTRRAA
jgi:CelD/BcsL family acetyltransferase involved in cellulose biosynthesis/RimJ/RimL family protein N-acetyltransferase